MPRRKTKFIRGGTYHVYDRGSNKMPIFFSKSDYVRFEKIIEYYRFNPKLSFSKARNCSDKYLDSIQNKPNTIVHILSYCAMPNHFHLELKQIRENGIPNFMSRLLNSYAHYFNHKYGRVGPLLQSRFQDVPIESTYQMLYLSAYIHCNPFKASIVDSKESLLAYPYSSLGHYAKFFTKTFITESHILRHFESRHDYIRYNVSSL